MIKQKIVRHFYNYDSRVESEELNALLRNGYLIKNINTKMTPETKWGVTKCLDVIVLEKEIKEKIKNKL